MTGIALDNSNDIFIDKEGKLALCKDIEAVTTSVNCAMRTNYGEIVLDTTFGVPYFETIFTAHPDIDLWTSFVKKCIMQVPKVLDIPIFKTYIEKKLLKYTIVINTEYGQEAING